MKQSIKPMLCQEATMASRPFDDPDYIWEPKYDGARIIAYVNWDGGETKLFSRSGKEKTALFPDLKIRTKVPCILDGEIISNDFNGIQHRINRQSGVSSAAKQYPAIYKVFDVLQVELGQEQFCLYTAPLQKRKDALAELLIPDYNVHLTEYTEQGLELFERIEASGGEGVIGKKLNGMYLPNKREWLKVKTWQLDQFVVIGYTPGTGWRKSSFGALVLAKWTPEGQLKHVGEVGTGFTESDIRAICGLLIPTKIPALQVMIAGGAKWVMPFTIKVRYLEYTNDGRLRFPSFKGVV
jgi:ATP-dependent DNA ligase